MPSINGVSSPAMDYASEVYSANLAKAAQQQKAEQDLALLAEATKTSPLPLAVDPIPRRIISARIST